jgi:hypothetical protein
MAVKLSDIVFRRSALAEGSLSRSTVVEIAQLASAELGWDTMRQQAEIDEVIQSGAMLPAEEPVV